MINIFHKSDLKHLVEETDTWQGRAFDRLVQVLIIISIVSFSTETLPDLSQQTRSVLYTVEMVTVILFTLEYALRIYAADSKKRYVFSFFGLIDLLAILPFYVTQSTDIDLLAVRAFRLLRLFRALELTRYSQAMSRLHQAVLISREEIVLFFSLTAILLYLSAVGIYYFEHQVQPEAFKSVFHSLWWSVTTLTTVGYGDVYPITTGGRIFTFFILMVGMGIIAVPPGIVSAALSKARMEEEAAEKQTPVGERANGKNV